MPQRYNISSRPKSSTPANASKKKSAVVDKRAIIIVIIALTVLATGVAAFSIVKLVSTNNTLEKENTELKKQIEQLNQQLSSKTSSGSNPTVPTGITVPKSLAEDVQAAINSKNTAALAGSFAKSVKVSRAGSSTVNQNATQAVNSLGYLAGATDPWNWNLPASTLGEYQSGPYGQNFSDNTIVGTSDNGYVVSIGVDENGQIDSIFMSNSEADVVGPGGSE